MITEHLLDRLVIEGNPSFTLFFYLALLKRKEAELLSMSNSEDLYDCFLSMPWGLVDKDISSLIEEATGYQSTTPLSIHYGLYGILSQCSPGLLPVQVQGNQEIWISRMDEFYRYDYQILTQSSSCRYFNPEKRSRVEYLLEQWAGKEDIFEQACTKNYGVDRALSRSLYYPPIHSLASLPSTMNVY